MRYLVSEDVAYQKVWLELQALAWNRPELQERVDRVNAEWRAVLTEAFAEPREHYGIEMPLEALVSLVMTFNEGIIVERLSGVTEGTRSSSTGSTDGCRADRRDARADAGALPGRRGLRRARRRRRLLRGLRRGRADGPAAADVVDHPLAPLEDADPVPRAPLPRRHVRRRAATAARTGRDERGVRRARVRRRRARGDGRDRDRARGRSSRSRWARSGRCCSRPSTPSASRAPSSSRPSRAARRAGLPRRGDVLVATSELDTDEGWAKYNRHYWLRDYRGFLEFFFSQMFTEPHSTKPIEDCVGWGLETTAETLIATQPGACLDEDAQRELCRARPLPGARDPGRRGRDHRPTAAGSGSPRRRAASSSCSRARATAPHVRDPVKVNLLLRDFIAPPAPPRALGARQVAPQARALRLLADRARPRAARRRDRRRAAQAPSRPRDRLARPASGDGGAGGARASGSIPASAFLANESSHIESESRRARPALLPGDPAHGRDPARELHGLPRPRPRRARTTSGSATRRGSSTTTCTRTPSRSGPPTSG